ncbi:LAFA_0E05578g1_1 [Lachancea sp. 'fantastica']|nr:LAFA_0E05578g1_1 [Lachancea sp. 'fantastica']
MVKSFLEVLETLPLDIRTLDVLAGKLRSSTRPQELISLLHQYELTRENKTLENIIHFTYFQCNNGLPPHIRLFRTHYVELRDHWPHERHRSILSMENPKSQSLRFLWSNDNSKVLTAMRYQPHCWGSSQNPEAQHALPELRRTVLFHEIFQHYLFLKKNPHLCKNRRALAIPIVEIPMDPLGHTIADSRIRNLFKHKVAHVWNVLALENPALSPSQEGLLTEIVHNPLPSSAVANRRSLQRIYRRACRGAYVIQPHPDFGVEIQESSLLKQL